MKASDRQPFVSIVIPTFNRSWGLERAVRSVLAQSYSDFELVIIDDASPDDTETVARSFKDERIQYIRQPTNVGMVKNWGEGVARAAGQFLVFLADDDELRPDFLKTHVEVLEKSPEAFAVFSRCGSFTLTGERVGTSLEDRQRLQALQGAELVHLAFTGWCIGATLYRTRSVQAVWAGVKEDDLVLDIGLNLRLALSPPGQAIFLPREEFAMTVHPGQNSQAKIQAVFQQKTTLLSYFLKTRLPADVRRVLRLELYWWLLLWGRHALAAGRKNLARKHFAQATLLEPLRRQAWWQIVKTINPYRSRYQLS